MLAGTAFLCASYVGIEVYFRGDLSELTGMMLVPWALHWAMVWLDEGRHAAWYALAATAGAVVCAHPVAGLLGYGALVVVIACWVAMGADRRRGATALAALVAGVALAAFYVAPIGLEWDLVQGTRLTFDDAPLPFVEIGNLLGIRRIARRLVAIPVDLGIPTLVLAGIAAVEGARRWGTFDATARRTLSSLAVLAAGVVFLMHPASHLVWETLPVLRLVQFPARALLVPTPVLACLVGALVGRSWTGAVLGTLWLAGPPLIGLAMGVRTKPAVYEHADRARGLAAFYVAPDGAGEWLPRDAEAFLPLAVPKKPTCVGTCSLTTFERSTARLRIRVITVGESVVTLPHYYFPVGWRATFDGLPVPLARTERGLMRVTIGTPGKASVGTLDVQFFTTPARRLGIAISLLTAAALLTSAARCRPAREHLVPQARAG